MRCKLTRQEYLAFFVQLYALDVVSHIHTYPNGVPLRSAVLLDGKSPTIRERYLVWGNLVDTRCHVRQTLTQSGNVHSMEGVPVLAEKLSEAGIVRDDEVRVTNGDPDMLGWPVGAQLLEATSMSQWRSRSFGPLVPHHLLVVNPPAVVGQLYPDISTFLLARDEPGCFKVRQNAREVSVSKAEIRQEFLSVHPLQVRTSCLQKGCNVFFLPNLINCMDVVEVMGLLEQFCQANKALGE
ncbi:hypothetical protein D3C71_1385820 [compost metagenome]